MNRQLVQLLQSKVDARSLLESTMYIQAVENEEILAIDAIRPLLLSFVLQDFNDQLDRLSENLTTLRELLDLKGFAARLDLNVYHLMSIFDKTSIPEPQLAMISKIYNVLYQNQADTVVRNSIDCLMKILPHIGSSSANSIVLLMFQKEHKYQQLEYLRQGFLQFNNFDELQVINFTYLIHEIMTQHRKEYLVSYILEQLEMMFKIIQDEENYHFIIVKNAGHIISLISNYYSIKLQNINLDDDLAITQEFEKSSFFFTVTRNLHIIAQLLKNSIQNRSKLGLFRIKLVEITDNLVRTSNLRLWREIHKHQIIKLLMDLVKKYPTSDILISYFEKLILYIFDRALCDFHPYWAQQIIVYYRLYDEQLPIITNQMQWFEKELKDKMLEEGEFIKFYKEIREIEFTINYSTPWKVFKGEEQATKLQKSINNSPVIVSAMDICDRTEEQPKDFWINCKPVQDVQEVSVDVRDDIRNDVRNDVRDLPDQDAHQPNGWEIVQLEKVQVSPKVQSKPSPKFVPLDTVDEIKDILNQLDLQFDGSKSNESNGSPTNIKFTNHHPSQKQIQVQVEEIRLIGESNGKPDSLSVLKLALEGLDDKDNEEPKPKSNSKTHTPTRNLSQSENSAENHAEKNQKQRLMHSTSSEHNELAQKLVLARRSSLQFSLQTKNFSLLDNQSFQIDEGQKKVFNDKSIIKVDELDDEKYQIKITFKKCKQNAFLEAEKISSDRAIKIKQDSPLIGSADERRFRKLQNKDKIFLNFLDKIE